MHADYRASSKGIYVVFWFGITAPLQSPPKGISLPTSPAGMETALIRSLPADRRADIAVVLHACHVSASLACQVDAHYSQPDFMVQPRFELSSVMLKPR